MEVVVITGVGFGATGSSSSSASFNIAKGFTVVTRDRKNGNNRRR